MSFFKNLFHNKKCSESVVLVDIAADSVAGAYMRYTEGELPTILYTRRIQIRNREDEPHEQAMLRVLLSLGNELIHDGAPILMRATGSGNAENILVSVDTPWQETKVRTENFERETPFVFTKSIVATALEKTSVVPPKKFLADESIIGTILNGYETHSPYGKKVRRASLIIMTTLIDKNISDTVVSTLSGLYHTKNILPIAGNSLRYQAMRNAFPHEREALILDATGPIISIALIRKGLFVALAEESPSEDDLSWIKVVKKKFSELAKQYPLPRTIFLLARESKIPALQKLLQEANFESLWLSDNPPKIVPVLASHIVNSIRQTTTTPPDLQLILMALYYSRRAPEE